jgi:hypothetical protein
MVDGTGQFSAADFVRLEATARAAGPTAMLDELAAALKAAGRWHALFDLRLVQARLAAGLSLAGGTQPDDPAAQATLDERSLAACREAGQGLLDEDEVAAAWMYLRAAMPAEEVATRLAAVAARALPAGAAATLDIEASRLVDELLGVALWEAVDPALGIEIMLRSQGICAAITAFEQAVSRLPARRQEPAAVQLVAHLHGDVVQGLAADLTARGVDPAPAVASATPLISLLELAGGLADAPALYVDVSHLQSVLRIARVCAKDTAVRQAWELAAYACRLPPEVTYPGEPPFENVGQASRLFFGAALGIDVEGAIKYFRRAAAMAEPELAGTLPSDTLVLLLARAGRPAEALHAAVSHRHSAASPSPMQTGGLVPSLVELAAASGEWDLLLDACRRHGDAITFAAALAASHRG